MRSTPGIWTTDRSGQAGYNAGRIAGGDAAGDYTNNFGGTSSACPGAAGVVALILSVNPALTWLEVRDVLKGACDRIDPRGGRTMPPATATSIGFGRLNAPTAVALAPPQPHNR